MARIVKIKELVNARLLKEYASWIYCESCGKTVSYLCYVTYDDFDFNFNCACGMKGHVKISFGELETTKLSEKPLELIKNRLCCPEESQHL